MQKMKSRDDIRKDGTAVDVLDKQNVKIFVSILRELMHKLRPKVKQRTLLLVDHPYISEVLFSCLQSIGQPIHCLIKSFALCRRCFKNL